MRRLTWSVYVMAMSLMLVLLVLGWAFRERARHQDQLAEAVLTRQREVNKFLREEVCERLELRDEIHLVYLRAARDRYRRSDPSFSQLLGDSVEALEFTQRGCIEALPELEEEGG